MADDEVEHAEYGKGARERRQAQVAWPSWSRAEASHRATRYKECQQPALGEQIEGRVVKFKLGGGWKLPRLVLVKCGPGPRPSIPAAMPFSLASAQRGNRRSPWLSSL